MADEISSNKDTIKTLTQENESLKATDTAIVLYESKFKELNEVNQKNASVLKVERDKVQEQEQKVKHM